METKTQTQRDTILKTLKSLVVEAQLIRDEEQIIDQVGNFYFKRVLSDEERLIFHYFISTTYA